MFNFALFFFRLTGGLSRSLKKKKKFISLSRILPRWTSQKELLAISIVDWKRTLVRNWNCRYKYYSPPLLQNCYSILLCAYNFISFISCPEYAWQAHNWFVTKAGFVLFLLLYPLANKRNLYLFAFILCNRTLQQ